MENKGRAKGNRIVITAIIYVILSAGCVFPYLSAGAAPGLPEDSVAAIITDSPASDTVPASPMGNRDYDFRPVRLILPGFLVAAGTFGYFSSDFHRLNETVKNGMDRWRRGRYLHIDDYVQYLPAVAYPVLQYAGVKAKHDLKERLAVELTAYLAMAAITNIAKYTLREKRPDSNSRNSFPSGHTATAFTGAELMRIEYGLWPGIASYTLATGVAFLRLYNGRHWLNDVIAGAGVGILSARIGYWMLPLYRKWFKWDKKRGLNCVSILPSYDASSRSGIINAVISLY